jgi:hypothetical protein
VAVRKRSPDQGLRQNVVGDEPLPAKAPVRKPSPAKSAAQGLTSARIPHGEIGVAQSAAVDFKARRPPRIAVPKRNRAYDDLTPSPSSELEDGTASSLAGLEFSDGLPEHRTPPVRRKLSPSSPTHKSPDSVDPVEVAFSSSDPIIGDYE